mgnify:FL=1
MVRQDRIVIAAGAFALVFLIAGYIKENNMRIHLTFTGQDNKTHHVEGEWPSVADAVDWARKLFNASTVIPFRI